MFYRIVKYYSKTIYLSLSLEVSSMNKLQALLIKYLTKHGNIELLLPDGIVLEIGINQEAEDGTLKFVEDYCWVIASRQDRAASIDSYNLGLQFNDNNRTIVFEDVHIDERGDKIRRLDVV